MPEADESDMEYFISQVQIVLPVLGVNVFRSAATAPVAAVTAPRGELDNIGTNDVAPLFELHLRKDGVRATAREVDGEFTVLAGSGVREAWIGSDHHDGYNRLREQLIQDGTIVRVNDGPTLAFAYDHVFGSPSAAAAVIVGRGANGRTDWRTSAGVSYGEWQNKDVEESTPDMVNDRP